jgi:hypothetical protein
MKHAVQNLMPSILGSNRQLARATDNARVRADQVVRELLPAEVSAKERVAA